MCDMNLSYVWHDPFICVPWLIHMQAMTHSHVWHDACISAIITWIHTNHVYMEWRDTLCMYTWNDMSRIPEVWDTAFHVYMHSVLHHFAYTWIVCLWRDYGKYTCVISPSTHVEWSPHPLTWTHEPCIHGSCVFKWRDSNTSVNAATQIPETWLIDTWDRALWHSRRRQRSQNRCLATLCGMTQLRETWLIYTRDMSS